MSLLRAPLCGLLSVFAVTSVLAAQELRDTIGPLEQKANPITPENPIPRRTQSVAPSYPPEGRSMGAIATVVLAVTIEEWGCVAEIRRGPEPRLTTAAKSAPTEAALEAAADAFMREGVAVLRHWQYARPARPPISFSVSFTFRPDAETTSTQIAAAVPLPPLALPAGPRPPEPVRVGVISMSPRLVRRVEPVYPTRAMSARVEGTVVLEARIDATGKVTDAKVLRSIPLLDQAALAAVRQWRYAPICFSGAGIPLIITVPVSFKLP
jgi:TonB family protein